MKSLLIGVLLGATLASASHADVRLPALVGDHMVLQRNDTVTIWGWADPGEPVLVSTSWSDRAARTVTNELGEWSVPVVTGSSRGPHSVKITANNEIVLQDILLGEVWVCGGQSNMEWPLRALSADIAEVEALGQQPNIRLFTVGNQVSPTPAVDCKGAWQVCNADNVGNFSAVGYFFGHELARDLDLPIGLISCNWGGTLAEAWTSERTLRDWPDFAEALNFVRECATSADAVEQKQAVALEAWWADLDRRDRGTRKGWQKLEHDDEAWQEMSVPNNWSGTPLADYDGIVWMRRDFDIPTGWAGKACMLTLGPIDDMDTTWINGVRVGGMQEKGMWNTDRQYEVPAGVLRAGGNVIAVRVFDSGGGGGLHGKPEQIALAPHSVSRPLLLAGDWKFAKSTPRAKLAPWPSSQTLHQNVPTALYNGMLAPLTHYAIRGAIWYQGEANVGRAKQYEQLFPAMIADWRTSWGRGDFPFYYVQIAPFGYGGDRGQAAALRDAQRLALRTPNTGMAVTMDIGNPGNIHPVQKFEVGRRLALWALAKTYGRPIPVWSGPLFDTIEIEGSALRVTFEDNPSELQVRGGGALTHFELAGNDRVFHAAEATIEGQTVIVKSAAVENPIAVRYAWGAADQPNLMNAAGLPASSFHSDNR